MVDKPVTDDRWSTTDAGVQPASTSTHGAEAPHDGPDACCDAVDGAGANGSQATTDGANAPSHVTLGADAPLDEALSSNVADFGAALRQRHAADLSSSSAAAPLSPEKAPAPSGRRGGKADAKKKGDGGGGKPPPKQPDWGKYNYLVKNFSLIYGTDTVWDDEHRLTMKISAMAHAHGGDMVKMWKASEQRRTVLLTNIVFDPTATCDADTCINLFDGMAHEPEPCQDEEIQVMLDLLRHLCSDCDSGATKIDDVMHWVLCWLALPLQRPGTKQQTALVFHGAQGTGKNLFFDCIKRIYGKYGAMIGQTELEDKYNAWLSAKMMLVADEVTTRQELYHNKNKLKWLITQTDPVPIRAMHADTRWETNYSNLVFLSNESKPLVLEPGDRRMLVVYTPVPAVESLYRRVADFLADGGEAKFYDYLLRYDIGDFHPHVKPLMTEAKKDLIVLSMQAHERFLHEWFEGFLPLPLRVCSAEQLYKAFMRWADMAGERYRPNREAFTREARRYVVERVDLDANGKRCQPKLSYKVINVRSPETSNGRKAMRCWIPDGCGIPEDGQSEGDWAAAGIDAFTTSLNKFYYSDRAPGMSGGQEDGND